MSKKRIAAIADGSWKPKPRKPIRKVAAGSLAASKLITRATGSNPKGERAKAMKDADKWFSQFIRLRDSDEDGFVNCVTSGRRMYWKEADCGHWISRAKMATRYDERNAHAQSKQANRFQGGHFLEHGLAIDRIHGEGTRTVLELKALQPCKRTTSDLLFLADTYKKRVYNMRLNSPGKFR